MIRPSRPGRPGQVQHLPPKVEPLKHKCGHDIQFHYRGATAEPCQACRVANATPVPEPPRPDTHTGEPKPIGKPERPVFERLPPGSEKRLNWNGSVWFGRLFIPDVAWPFEFTAESERACLHGLHAKWVEWRAAQKGGPQP